MGARFWLTLSAGLLLSQAAGCSDPEPGEPPAGNDPYADLPELIVDGDAVEVGPEGGRARFDGYTLEVPRGALDALVHIEARPSAASPFGDYGDPLGPVLELLPAGLVFHIPLRLSVVLYEEPPPFRGELPGFFMVSTTLDGADFEDVATLHAETSGRTVRGLIFHFSQVGVYEMPGLGPRVVDVLAMARAGMTTAPVAGLSLEIRRVFVEVLGQSLRELPMSASVVSLDPLGVPRVTPPAAESFVMAEARASGRRLYVESAWRSVAQQYVLLRGNPNDTADIGRSFHQVGAAIDVKTEPDVAGRCRQLAASQPSDVEHLRQIHPDWGAALTASSFDWYGRGNSGAMARESCKDAVHFDHLPSRTAALGLQGLRAFQTLWRRRAPCAPIPDAELAGTIDTPMPKTLEYIGAAPAGGWHSIDEVVLPAEGAGCAPPASICCPGADDELPYCAESCDPVDAGVDAGLQDTSVDTGTSDAEVADTPDAGAPDQGPTDVDPADGDPLDADPPDADPPDADPPDATEPACCAAGNCADPCACIVQPTQCGCFGLPPPGGNDPTPSSSTTALGSQNLPVPPDNKVGFGGIGTYDVAPFPGSGPSKMFRATVQGTLSFSEPPPSEYCDIDPVPFSPLWGQNIGPLGHMPSGEFRVRVLIGTSDVPLVGIDASTAEGIGMLDPGQIVRATRTGGGVGCGRTGNPPVVGGNLLISGAQDVEVDEIIDPLVLSVDRTVAGAGETVTFTLSGPIAPSSARYYWSANDTGSAPLGQGSGTLVSSCNNQNTCNFTVTTPGRMYATGDMAFRTWGSTSQRIWLSCVP